MEGGEVKDERMKDGREPYLPSMKDRKDGEKLKETKGG